MVFDSISSRGLLPDGGWVQDSFWTTPPGLKWQSETWMWISGWSTLWILNGKIFQFRPWLVKKHFPNRFDGLEFSGGQSWEKLCGASLRMGKWKNAEMQFAVACASCQISQTSTVYQNNQNWKSTASAGPAEPDSAGISPCAVSTFWCNPNSRFVRISSFGGLI